MGKDELWYMKILIGKNTLHLLSKRLTNDLSSLKGKLQIRLVEVTISPMVDALVPIEYGMKVSRHCDPKSFAK
jgi:hypothetical protein